MQDASSHNNNLVVKVPLKEKKKTFKNEVNNKMMARLKVCVVVAGASFKINKKQDRRSADLNKIIC